MVYDGLDDMKSSLQGNPKDQDWERKIMKRLLLLTAISLWICCGNAVAQDHCVYSGLGVTLGYGQSQDDIDIHRLGLSKKWNVRWLKNRLGYVDGYFEFSVNHWDGENDDITGAAFSPVFIYAFNPGNKTCYPYIEGGVGVAYIDEYKIGSRNLASNFQFEDRIGVGYRYKNLDINVRYMHYSNASLEEPNDGIDIWMGTLAWYF